MFIKKRRNHTKSLAKVQSKTLTHTRRQERAQLMENSSSSIGGKENRLARLGSGISQCQLAQCQQVGGGGESSVCLQAKGKVNNESAPGLRYNALGKLLNISQHIFCCCFSSNSQLFFRNVKYQVAKSQSQRWFFFYFTYIYIYIYIKTICRAARAEQHAKYSQMAYFIYYFNYSEHFFRFGWNLLRQIPLWC